MLTCPRPALLTRRGPLGLLGPHGRPDRSLTGQSAHDAWLPNAGGDFSYSNLALLFNIEVEIGDHTYERNPPAKEDHHVHRSDGSKKTHKVPKTDDVISTITDDSFISFRKKIHFPNDLLKMTKTLNDWNNKFVKVKYLQGEYNKKYDGKVKEMQTVEKQLAECRVELTNRITSASSPNEQMDRLHIELVDAKAMIN
ncbi:hypothetical protein MA16_Dca026984 [Dendrobium catenatum]|uniref:Uncharacterized protein n=1 Tax=Dendrobium catenatum TaxID=906689 RepID=A0A2I0XAM3_9ASPA|nr:hypothetical protein MA16_Dca026984 [Dendrobium catenatum]